MLYTYTRQRVFNVEVDAEDVSGASLRYELCLQIVCAAPSIL